jgi:hypothetical protein
MSCRRIRRNLVCLREDNIQFSTQTGEWINMFIIAILLVYFICITGSKIMLVIIETFYKKYNSQPWLGRRYLNRFLRINYQRKICFYKYSAHTSWKLLRHSISALARKGLKELNVTACCEHHVARGLRVKRSWARLWAVRLRKRVSIPSKSNTLSLLKSV